MPMYTKQREIFEQGAHPKASQDSVTVGTVVDTNDPQQMGRVRIVCPQWGDSWNTNVEDLPWAVYVTPFGGQSQVGTRGPGIQESEGGIAYGMWAIPKLGAQAVVMCIDGNPMTRMYFGCIYDQFTPHTMPHGRFMYDDHPELEKGSSDAKPFGPYTSAEKFIQPLADNMRQAFGNKSEKNYEFHSRGADQTVTRLDVSQLNQTYSKVQDDKDFKYDDWTSTQGYQLSRIDPFSPSSYTDKNYDSMSYCITTPGFHSFSMDDRQENCRIRVRSTAGHQIIVDDTNERIYIATAKGNNWIEMDQDGNIDVFTTNKLNIHANKEINLTSDDTIRMYAKKGIHMYSEDEVRIQALKDINVKTDQNMQTQTGQDYSVNVGQVANIQTGEDINVNIGQTANIQTGEDINVNIGQIATVQTGEDLNVKVGQIATVQTGEDLNVNVGQTATVQTGEDFTVNCGNVLILTSGNTMNFGAGGNMIGTAPEIHWNGPAAASAPSAPAAPSAPPAPPAPLPALAFWTDRVPNHEPWARVMTKDDFTHEPELPYDDEQVNRVERGRTINRSMFWRR